MIFWNMIFWSQGSFNNDASELARWAERKTVIGGLILVWTKVSHELLSSLPRYSIIACSRLI
jgi:hypothetical protein